MKTILGIEERILEDKTRKFLNENLDKELYMLGVYVDKMFREWQRYIMKQFIEKRNRENRVIYSKENE